MEWFAWVKNPKLRAAADLILNGGRLLEEDARRVLDDLWEESGTHILNKVGATFYNENFPSHRDGGEWDEGRPYGVIDHYTAGISVVGTLKWFSNMTRSGTSSAHAIVDHGGRIYLVINPLTHIAWHARRDSYTHVGIEHVNAGLLRKENGKFFYQGTRRYPNKYKHLPQHLEEWWEPFRVAQIVSNIVLKRWLIYAIPTLQQQHFVDHQTVDPNRKTDCGPFWPLDEINELVFSAKPIRDLDWMKKEFLLLDDVGNFRMEVREYLS